MIVTLITGGLLGIILLLLGFWVVRRRMEAKVMVGDGGDPELIMRMRAQANFVEYAPLCLLLLLLAEQSMAGKTLPIVAAALLVVGRLAHPFGMARPAPNPFRMIGILGTWLALLILSVSVLVVAAGLV